MRGVVFCFELGCVCSGFCCLRETRTSPPDFWLPDSLGSISCPSALASRPSRARSAARVAACCLSLRLGGIPPFGISDTVVVVGVVAVVVIVVVVVVAVVVNTFPSRMSSFSTYGFSAVSM